MESLYNTETDTLKKLKPRKVKWSSHQLLKKVTSQHITASEELKTAVHHDLWGDMCAENDAERLWMHLTNLNINFSLEFMEALKEWREDEQNHYIGLRKICSLLYNVAESNIDEQMKMRIPDFKELEHFLKDEFTICMVLAYDELVSARGYTIFSNDFRKFGPTECLQWVQWAARDEALHYQNFLDIVKIVHTKRLPEAEEIIRQISIYENRDNYTYRSTFLLDHTAETFERKFLDACGTMVLNALKNGGIQ